MCISRLTISRRSILDSLSIILFLTYAMDRLSLLIELLRKYLGSTDNIVGFVSIIIIMYVYNGATLPK